MRRTAISLLTAALVLVGLLVAAPAQATFPGANGRLVITRHGDIGTIKPNSSGFQRLTRRFNDAEAPQVSADGQWIVFGAQGDAPTYQMWKIRIDGTGLKRIYTESTWAPSFSPDGKLITFTSGSQIARVKADGSNFKELSTVGCAEWSRYSPNGNRIVFSSCVDGDSDLYIMNADGSDEHAITTAATDERYPDWSPDGQRISYISNAGGTNHVEIVDPDGTDIAIQLATDFANYGAPWSPDGRLLAFIDFDVDLLKRVQVGEGNFNTQIGPVSPHYGVSWQAK